MCLSKSISKALVQLCSCSAKQCIDMYTALQQLTFCMALRRGTLVLAAVIAENTAQHTALNCVSYICCYNKHCCSVL
jgi:hypothetical protein